MVFFCASALGPKARASHSRAAPAVETPPERFHSPSKGSGRERSARDGKGFVGAEVQGFGGPGSSQAMPGSIAPEPTMAARKSGKPVITGTPAARPSRSAASGTRRPASIAGGARGGKRSRGRPRASRRASLQT